MEKTQNTEAERVIKEAIRAAYEVGYQHGQMDGNLSCSRYVPGNVEAVMGNKLIAVLSTAAPAADRNAVLEEAAKAIAADRITIAEHPEPVMRMNADHFAELIRSKKSAPVAAPDVVTDADIVAIARKHLDNEALTFLDNTPNVEPVVNFARELLAMPAPTPTDSRAAFEKHFGLTLRQALRTQDGSAYQMSNIQDKWEGWQAAKGEDK